jgi:hypothetical protein
MELQQERPPSYDPLTLPSPPNNDLTTTPTPSNINLPDLRSLGLPLSQSSHLYRSSQDWKNGSQNASAFANSFPAVPTNPPRASAEPSLGSPVATESVMSIEERGNKTPSVVSMDDPETRMAAEALSGLRNLGEFALLHSHMYMEGAPTRVGCIIREHCVMTLAVSSFS